MAEQYLTHSRAILSDPRSGYKPNRTGIDSISLFGYQNEYDLAAGFPLLTTKRIPIKSIIHELIWFLRGDSNIKYLADNNVHIWDGNAFQHYLRKEGRANELPMYSPAWKQALDEYVAQIKEDEEFARQHGNLGEVYGAQWRHWKTSDGEEIDQLAEVIDLLARSPQSRRIIVTAWNPEQVPGMALPPCHSLYQLNVLDGKLDCQMYQRSCDMFLGVPFNIASYALLTRILAQNTALQPGRFIHTFGDSHFYCGGGKRGEFYGEHLVELKQKVHSVSSLEEYCAVKEWIETTAPAEPAGREGQDHVTAILEQLCREPRPLPTMQIAPKDFDKLTVDDFTLLDYNPHPPIKRAMAV